MFAELIYLRWTFSFMVRRLCPIFHLWSVDDIRIVVNISHFPLSLIPPDRTRGITSFPFVGFPLASDYLN